jgi:hypothetical protein
LCEKNSGLGGLLKIKVKHIDGWPSYHALLHCFDYTVG